MRLEVYDKVIKFQVVDLQARGVMYFEDKGNFDNELINSLRVFTKLYRRHFDFSSPCIS